MRTGMILSAFAFALSLTACKSSPTRTEAGAPTPSSSADANLSQSEAEQRAALIHDVKYQLNMNISAPGEKFTATEKIEFTARSAENTFLDFKEGGKIDSF